MKCIVCGDPATGPCPTLLGYINRAGDKPHIVQICGKPLCDKCGHGHGGESNRTIGDFKQPKCFDELTEE